MFGKSCVSLASRVTWTYPSTRFKSSLHLIAVSKYSSAPKMQDSRQRAHKETKNDFPYKVGFIGAGNMARAIGFSSVDAGILTARDLMVSSTAHSYFELWKEKGIATTVDNAEVVNFADIVFIASPPQNFDQVIGSLQASNLCASNHKCFVSTMVGKTIKTLEELKYGTPTETALFRIVHPFLARASESLKSVSGLKVSPQVIRVTPNMPAVVGAGCSVMVCDEKGKYSKHVLRLLKASGSCEIIPEGLMNVCSAVSGSGPAYLYLVIEGLADGAVRAGMPRALAYKLAAQTVIGAGQMVLKTSKHPGVLKDEICSAGGTTIAGVQALEEGGVRKSFINAIVAATKRAEEPLTKP